MSKLENIKNNEPATKKKYHAKTNIVHPIFNRKNFESQEECFLGISLENKNFVPEKFIAMAKWINQRFKRCHILIGDSIHRITLETNKKYTPEHAFPEAIKLGEAYRDQAIAQLELYKFQTEFSFVTCYSLQQTPEYQNFHSNIDHFFYFSKKFRESVEKFSLIFHRYHWDNLNELQRKYCIDKSSQYFLEEFSIFACLVKKGINVMVYPGTFGPLTEIVNGEHNGIIDELENLTVISLNIKNVNKSKSRGIINE